MDGISFISYGVRVGLRVNRPGVLDRLLEYLPPGWKPSPSPVVERMYSLLVGGNGSRPNVRRYNILYGDIEIAARTLNFDELLDQFERDLQIYIATAAPRRVFVHAGVVGWRGKAIIIPGRSFSGKTSLVAELVKAGATYYSDEYAVLDGRGRVHHYARPLSIRENGQVASSKKYKVETLGGRAGVNPLPVGMVVVSKYKPGARWRPSRVSAGQGALALLDNTVSVRRQPQAALTTLQKVVAGAPVFKGTRGEAGEVVDFIFDYLKG